MSVDDSRARSTGPFVHTVASATWFALMLGLCSTISFELAAALVGQVAGELAQLAFGVLKQGVGDVDVPAVHLQSHGDSFTRSAVLEHYPASPPDGGAPRQPLSARASVTASTRSAPPRRSEKAAAEMVAPVVRTSSTSTTERPATG